VNININTVKANKIYKECSKKTLGQEAIILAMFRRTFLLGMTFNIKFFKEVNLYSLIGWSCDDPDTVSILWIVDGIMR